MTRPSSLDRTGLLLTMMAGITQAALKITKIAKLSRPIFRRIMGFRPLKLIQ
jgi:hypothetical protein